VNNCVDWLQHMLEPESTQLVDHPHILGEIKLFFVKNWTKLVSSPNLEMLPSRTLVELMRLRINEDLCKKLEKGYEQLKDDISVKKDTLGYACMNLYGNTESADFKFCIGNKEISVHKYILAANAPHHHLPVAEETKIECQSASDVKSFETLIQFIYTCDFLESRAVGLEEAHGLWQTGMYFLEGRGNFEERLCKWFLSGLDEKSIFKLLVDMEHKPYALILRDAALDYVVENIAVLGKQLQIHNLPKPILVEVLQKLC